MAVILVAAGVVMLFLLLAAGYVLRLRVHAARDAEFIRERPRRVTE